MLIMVGHVEMSLGVKRRYGRCMSGTAKVLYVLVVLVFGVMACRPAMAQEKQLMVRVAEIELVPEFIDDYKAILKEEAAASVKLEPGVIAIFPMYLKERASSVRILEIYRDKASYEAHLKTPHFQKYKTTTANMVKSLKLTDMALTDESTLPLLFKKWNE
jgi:quinol monooxygenase YgiN